MAEYNAVASQIVNPGEAFIFTTTPVPCRLGLIRHREGTGNFLLAGYSILRRICGMITRNRTSQYEINFGSNVAIPEGGTVAPISVSISLDGTTVQASTMQSTPSAAQEFNNISRDMSVDIWTGCCESISVVNTGTQPIEATSSTITINPKF